MTELAAVIINNWTTRYVKKKYFLTLMKQVFLMQNMFFYSKHHFLGSESC